uniref:NTF2 domain-containing protein n=1 Tax=Globodera pallida TaxID=36090 RepID=A0A183C3C7_GLOPA
MQSAIKYFISYYGLADIAELYSFFKEEIESSLGNYFPNPLAGPDHCVHIINQDHHNQPVVVEGTLDLVADLELFTTCYPKRATGVDWSEPLYVELKDLMICPGESQQCLYVQRNHQQHPWIIDELDEDDDVANATW